MLRHPICYSFSSSRILLPSLYEALTRRNFHVSSASRGHKVRAKPTKKFFLPSSSFWQRRANLWKNGAIDDKLDVASSVAHKLAMYSHPLGDLYRKEWEIKTVEDEEEAWKARYFQNYPEERLLFIEYDDANKKFLQLPYRRFLNHLKKMKKLSPFTDEETIWRICISQKEWENEALQIEKTVCAHQAREMFGIPQGEDLEYPELLKPGDYDPRITEHETRLERERLDALVQERRMNSDLPPITLEESGVPLDVALEYLSHNEDVRGFFDEGIYWDHISRNIGYQGSLINENGELNATSLETDIDNNLKNWASILLKVESEPEEYEEKDLENLDGNSKIEDAVTSLFSTGLAEENNTFGDLFFQIKQFKEDFALPSTFIPPPTPSSTTQIILDEFENKSNFLEKDLEQELQNLFKSIKSTKPL